MDARLVIVILTIALLAGGIMFERGKVMKERAEEVCESKWSLALYNKACAIDEALCNECADKAMRDGRRNNANKCLWAVINSKK